MIRKQTMNYQTFATPTFPNTSRLWLIGFAVWIALVLPLGAFWVANMDAARAQTAQSVSVTASQAQWMDGLNAGSAQERINTANALAKTGDAVALAKLDAVAFTDSEANVRQAANSAAHQVQANIAKSAGMNDPSVSALALAPQDSKYIVMTDHRDVLISHDGGVTWQRQVNVLPSVATTLAVSPTDENVMYTGITDFGFYKSADGGNTWQPMNTGLAVTPGARFGITAIAIDPKNADRIFIAAGVWLGTSHVTFYPIGIMGSSDGGQTWTNIENDPVAMQTGRLVFVENALFAVSGDSVRQIQTN